MAVSLQDLTTVPTQEELEDMILVLCLVAGLPATQWQPGGVARTLIKGIATVGVSVATVVATIAKAGFNSEASGNELTILSAQRYAHERTPATFADIQVALEVTSSGAGPYTLVAGQTWFRWGDGSNAKRYRSTSGGSLSFGGGELIVNAKAESPGSAYNAPPNSIQLITELAGVEVNGSTLLAAGVDAQSDLALRTRNEGRWGSVGSAANNAGYAKWALDVVGVTRVRVYQHTPVDGSVRVVIAGPAGAPSPGVNALVVANIEQYRPLCITVGVVDATPQTVTVSGTLNIKTTHANALNAKAQVEAEITEYLAGVELGGTVFFGDIIAIAEGVPGVENTVITAPTANITLGANNVPVLSSTLVANFV